MQAFMHAHTNIHTHIVDLQNVLIVKTINIAITIIIIIIASWHTRNIMTDISPNWCEKCANTHAYTLHTNTRIKFKNSTERKQDNWKKGAFEMGFESI